MKLYSKIALAGLISGGLIGSPPTAEAATANDVLRTCENFLQTAKTNAQGLIIVHNQDAASCYGFFTAVHSLAYLRVVSEQGEPDKTPVLKGCPPNGVSLSQLIRIFVSYAQNNPQRLHEDATHLVIGSLMHAFPCPD